VESGDQTVEALNYNPMPAIVSRVWMVVNGGLKLKASSSQLGACQPGVPVKRTGIGENPYDWKRKIFIIEVGRW
jgi:hypothetical protein